MNLNKKIVFGDKKKKKVVVHIIECCSEIRKEDEDWYVEVINDLEKKWFRGIWWGEAQIKYAEERMGEEEQRHEYRRLLWKPFVWRGVAGW